MSSSDRYAKISSKKQVFTDVLKNKTPTVNLRRKKDSIENVQFNVLPT